MKWDRSRGRPEPIRALNKIIEQENMEPLVDMREACPSLIIMRPSVLPFCRATVAKMAERAAKSVPSGFRLGCVDAWRPFYRQKRIYEWMWQCLNEAHPELSYAAKRRKICRWVAPIDQKAPPGHCTGAALDVFLLDNQGNEVDVASPFERFQSTATFTFGLSPEAHKHRMILYESMVGAGFSNCRDEYWHYSFGDAGWAVRTNSPSCIYGLVEQDESIWQEAQAEWEKRLIGRPNPFLS